MSDQRRAFERDKQAAIPWTTGKYGWLLRDLDNNELAQQLVIAKLHNQKSYKNRVLEEAHRRGVAL